MYKRLFLMSVLVQQCKHDRASRTYLTAAQDPFPSKRFLFSMKNKLISLD